MASASRAAPFLPMCAILLPASFPSILTSSPFSPCSYSRWSLRRALRPPSSTAPSSTSPPAKNRPVKLSFLQGDHILSVSASDPTAPQTGRVIDAHHAYFIPGLWDMHVHIDDLEDLPLYIANGVTGVRLMFAAKNARFCAPNSPQLPSRRRFSLAAPSSTATLPSGPAPSSFTTPRRPPRRRRNQGKRRRLRENLQRHSPRRLFRLG